MSLTRSKRFMTDRLPVAPPLRLRELCLDINSGFGFPRRKLEVGQRFGKDELCLNYWFLGNLPQVVGKLA